MKIFTKIKWVVLLGLVGLGCLSSCEREEVKSIREVTVVEVQNGGGSSHNNNTKCDTVALPALSSPVKSCFSTHYATDTLLHAYSNSNGSYSVICCDKGLFVTNVSPYGSAIGRIEVCSLTDSHTATTQSALPAAITTYLSKTYPNYVFELVYEEKTNGTITGYDVFITTNGVRMTIEFNAAGTVVEKSTTTSAT